MIKMEKVEYMIKDENKFWLEVFFSFDCFISIWWRSSWRWKIIMKNGNKGKNKFCKMFREKKMINWMEKRKRKVLKITWKHFRFRIISFPKFKLIIISYWWIFIGKVNPPQQFKLHIENPESDIFMINFILEKWKGARKSSNLCQRRKKMINNIGNMVIKNKMNTINIMRWKCLLSNNFNFISISLDHQNYSVEHWEGQISWKWREKRNMENNENLFPIFSNTFLTRNSYSVRIQFSEEEEKFERKHHVNIFHMKRNDLNN